MMVIVGYVARVAILYFSGCVRKTIPCRFALAMFVPGAFDLVGGGRCAPQEILRKRDFVCHCLLRLFYSWDNCLLIVRAASPVIEYSPVITSPFSSYNTDSLGCSI